MINLLRRRFFFSFFLMFSVLAFSQTNNKLTLENAEKLRLEADKILYENPDEALKIANKVYNLTKNTHSITFAHNAGLISEIYSIKGEHKKSIQYAEEAQGVYKKLGKVNYEIDMINAIGNEYAYLGLFDDGLNENWKAIQTAKSNFKKDHSEDNTKILAQSYTRRATIFDQQHTQFDSILENQRLAYNIGAKLKSEKNNMYKVMFANNLANTLLKKKKKNEKDLNEILSVLNVARNLDKKNLNSKAKAYISFNFGNYFYSKEEDEKAEQEYLSALQSAKKMDDLYLQKDCHNLLVAVYSDLKEPTKELEHRKAYDELIQKIDELEKRDTNAQVSKINKEQQKSFFKTKRNLVIIISAIVLLLIISIGFGIRNHRKSKKEFANYQKIIEKLQNQESLIPAPVISNSAAEKTTFSVSSDKEVEILKKLEKFERSEGFKNKNLSLSSMAESLGTNTAYLSTVINSNKNKNFNNYINELRINYIIHKLKNDPQYLKYKISHLAEECGFSSHNTFTIAFSNLAGVSPSNFVKFLTKERQIPENQ
ncbi:AraC-type DNA-binding protein [Epilithonimonas hungarica]|uniref:AraC-type DNA-binding protein n=2 Tax=Epilithonimonas hungarica TaxID=454006 RepID=A0A1G7VND7_9FLAO|nr:AraC-type DNA-binding protein [Epilithonimonas hungarica]